MRKWTGFLAGQAEGVKSARNIQVLVEYILKEISFAFYACTCKHIE